MYVCLYFHGFVHNLDCYSTSVYLWLCILFLLIVNLLLMLGFILIMCVHLQLYSFCLFYFVCRSFLLIYSIRLCLSLQFPLSSLNFFSLVTCFLVMNALFNCFAPVYFTSSSPYHPVFCSFFFFLVGILFYFLLYMLLWLL